LRLTVPTVVLPNGVFLEELAPLPAPGTFRATHPELGAAPFVLFLARLHSKKGLDVLADAFVELGRWRADVRLVVAGPDDGAQVGFLRQVKGAGIAPRVHVVGPLYGRDKLSALVDAACFCLPSRQEGFSVAITEALACGIPVVISEACHFPEVADAQAGIVVPLEPATIARALETILADPALGGRMGQAGAALVRSRYTWDAIAAACLKAYQPAHR
jgi:glycosyltransferase involved in cell wall biosynthesis